MSPRFNEGDIVYLVEDVENAMPFSLKIDSGTKLRIVRPGRYSEGGRSLGGKSTYRYTVQIVKDDGSLESARYWGIAEDILESLD